VVLGHLGAVGPVERVLVTGVLRAPPADRVYDGEIKRQTGCARGDTMLLSEEGLPPPQATRASGLASDPGVRGHRRRPRRFP
jgi:hypothetical protein